MNGINSFCVWDLNHSVETGFNVMDADDLTPGVAKS